MKTEQRNPDAEDGSWPLDLKRAKNPSNIVWKNMGRGKWARSCRKFSLKLLLVAILFAFALLNWSGNYMIMLTRYMQMPPDVNCPSVLTLTNNVEHEAFLEYLEQKDIDYLD